MKYIDLRNYIDDNYRAREDNNRNEQLLNNNTSNGNPSELYLAWPQTLPSAFISGQCVRLSVGK